MYKSTFLKKFKTTNLKSSKIPLFILMLAFIFSGINAYSQNVVTIGNSDVTINSNTTITGTSTSASVIVDGSCTLTLSDLNIDLSATGDNNTGTLGKPAIKIISGDVVLELDGVNNLKSGYKCAGIQIEGGSLVIKDNENDGSLNVIGGRYGAGIGGGVQAAGNNITIMGGQIRVAGGAAGAGIGGGAYAVGNNITIMGGVIYTWANQGAGIGGGRMAAGNNITIMGGAISARSNHGAGIGGGENGDANTITISSGFVIAISENAEGIGGNNFVTQKAGQTNGNAVIYTNSIEDESDKANWNGIINANVYGTQILTTTINIKADQTLNVSAGSTLKVKNGAYIINYGTIDIEGTLINEGGIVNLGVINGNIIGNDPTDYMIHDVNKGDVLIKEDCKHFVFNSGPSPAHNAVTVAEGTKATVIINNLDIDVSSVKNKAAFNIQGSSPKRSNITLVFEGKNFLKSGKNCAGIQLAYLSSLTLEAKTGLKDKLTVAGGVYGAGIGGGNNQHGAGITINSGTITVEGGEFGAGIGGGNNAAGANITINGGNINVTGGELAAGIGGGNNSYGYIITINGGNINVTGGEGGGAGIGGGNNSNVAKVRINGGKVNAGGGTGGGAGIGGGVSGYGDDIEINNANVTALGDGDGAGIGGGAGGNSTNFSIKGTSYLNASSIGDKSDKDNWQGIIFDGNTGVVIGDQAPDFDIEIPKNKTLEVDANISLTITTGNTLTNNGTINNNGTITNNGSLINNSEATIINTGNYLGAGNVTNKGIFKHEIRYRTGDATIGTAPASAFKNHGEPYIVPGNTGLLKKPNNGFKCWNTKEDGTGTDYAKGSEYTVNNIATLYPKWTPIDFTNEDYTLHSDATISGTYDGGDFGVLIIDGSCTVTLAGLYFNQGSTDKAAIQIKNGDVVLEIDGDNTLFGGFKAAGIEVVGGTLTIKDDDNNGNLSVLGGGYAAGIGGNKGCSSTCPITINGGTISVTGRDGGAGIGGGMDGNAENITINGGTITAKATGSRYGGAGIGSGRAGSCENITINGGVVYAKGGPKASGIGIGTYYSDTNGTASNITINGGIITAIVGSDYAWEKKGINGDDNFIIRGNAVVIATSIENKENQANWQGIVFEKKKYAEKFEGKVYGNVIIHEDFEISSGNELSIKPDNSLTVADDATITNNGIITVYKNELLNYNDNIDGSGKIIYHNKINIIGGTAFNASNEEITDAFSGDAINVKAITAPETADGFLRWEVVKGDLSVENTTSFKFTMPDEELTIQGFYDATQATLKTTTSSTFVYNTEAQKPILTWSLGGKTLEEGTDYELTYKNNINAGAKTDSEPPTVVFTGLQSYVGTQEYTFTIAPAPLTITLDENQGKVYGEEEPKLTYTLSTPLLGEDELTGKLARPESEDAGTYPITQGTLNNENYDITFVADRNFVISPRPLTVTPDANQSKTYGEEEPDITYTLSSPLLGDDKLTGKLSRLESEEAGTYPITQGTLNNDNYAINFASDKTFTINPKIITITPNDGQSKVYGDPDIANMTYTYSTLTNNDDASVFTGALGRAPGENVGTYTISKGNLSAGDNYILVFAKNKTFAITPKTVTVTPNDGQSKVYGDDNPDLTYTYTQLGNEDNAEVFKGKLKRVEGETVGDYAIEKGNLSAGNNYKLMFTTGKNFTITPKPVTITPYGDQSKEYGSADPNKITFLYSALGNNDNATVFQGKLIRAEGEDVGEYAISQGDLSAGDNYDLIFTEGKTFAVTPKQLTITPNANQSKVYGDDEPKITYTHSEFAFNDDETLFTGALSRKQGEDVGEYIIEKGNFSAGNNYNINLVKNKTFAITPKDLTITPNDNQTKVYGDDEPELIYTYSELANNDDESIFQGELKRSKGENVGTYAIKRGSLFAGNNYNMVIAPGKTFSITPKTVTVTPVENQSKIYGDADPDKLAYTYTSLGNNDDASIFLGSLSRAIGENAGTYNIGKGNLSAGGNYNLVFEEGKTFAIKPKPVTIIPYENQQKIYGDAEIRLTYKHSPLADIDNESVFFGALSREQGEDVGEYAITQGNLSAGDNYQLNLVEDKTFEITPKSIAVVADNKSKVHGEEDPEFTYVVKPLLINGDTFSGKLSREYGNHVGEYDILQGTLTAGKNYKINFVKGTFTITKVSGIADDFRKEVSVYPTVVSTGFTVETTGKQNILEVYTINGVKLMTVNLTSNKQFVGLGKIPSGLYIAKINGKSIKFIKQ